jgi:hypothetical protein
MADVELISAILIASRDAIARLVRRGAKTRPPAAGRRIFARLPIIRAAIQRLFVDCMIFYEKYNGKPIPHLQQDFSRLNTAK